MNQNKQDVEASASQSSKGKLDSSEALNDYQDINFIDLLIALGQEKMTLFVVTSIAILVGVAVSLLTPATYVARTIIMPSQQSNGGGGGALAGLSNLAGLAGLSGISGAVKSSDEMFVALMKSQSVQSALVHQLNLRDRYGANTLEDARQALSQNIEILSDKKSGLIVIDVQDKDAEFAAQLANAQVRELNLILSRLAVTEAQQRRAYYEQEILKTQAKLPELEMEFKKAQKGSGVEVASLLAEAGSLPGQIASKELQLQVLSRFAAPQNPEVIRLQGEISVLRAQLAKYALNKIDSRPSNQAGKGQPVDSERAGLVQRATQAYNTLKIQESLLDSYVRQLEIAKVDEAKEGVAVQVVDEARPPELRARPQRKKLVIAFTVVGFCLALVLAAFRAILRHVVATNEGVTRWNKLKEAWCFF